MDHRLEIILRNLVREGIVSSVDAANKKVRVIYPDKDNMVSGWLSVLQHSGAGVSVVPDGTPVHNHPNTTVTTWMPKVNDTVIVVYLPVFNADGFVLGAI